MRQPSPVRNIAVMAPYGTSLGSVAVSPAETPDVEPTIPPYIMAERKLSSLILLASRGVAIITAMDLTTPMAMARAMTSEEAPTALPVTAHVMKVTAPAPMVAISAGDV